MLPGSKPTAFTLFYTDDHRTDADGRRQFVLEWEDSRGPRGQYYFAEPERIVLQLRHDGHSVHISTEKKP